MTHSPIQNQKKADAFATAEHYRVHGMVNAMRDKLNPTSASASNATSPQASYDVAAKKIAQRNSRRFASGGNDQDDKLGG